MKCSIPECIIFKVQLTGPAGVLDEENKRKKQVKGEVTIHSIQLKLRWG